MFVNRQYQPIRSNVIFFQVLYDNLLGDGYLSPQFTEAPLNQKVRDGFVVIGDTLGLETFDVKDVNKTTVVNTNNDNGSIVGSL